MRLRVLQVRAGREGPTRLVPGEDGAVNLVVRLHGGEVADETLVEVGAPGIAGPRAAERDEADGGALLIDDGHGRSSYTPR